VCKCNMLVIMLRMEIVKASYLLETFVVSERRN
jgi:hypothetical protein